MQEAEKFPQNLSLMVSHLKWLFKDLEGALENLINFNFIIINIDIYMIMYVHL